MEIYILSSETACITNPVNAHKTILNRLLYVIANVPNFSCQNRFHHSLTINIYTIVTNKNNLPVDSGTIKLTDVRTNKLTQEYSENFYSLA